MADSKMHIFVYGAHAANLEDNLHGIKQLFEISVHDGNFRGHQGAIISMPRKPDSGEPVAFSDTDETVRARAIQAELERTNTAPAFPPEYTTLRGVSLSRNDLVWHMI